jgi:hypothetical protein
MSTLDTIVKDYDKNIVLRDCQRQAFEYLQQKLSHDRSLHDHVFWDYIWDAYRDREPARTDNSVWEIDFDHDQHMKWNEPKPRKPQIYTLCMWIATRGT